VSTRFFRKTKIERWNISQAWWKSWEWLVMSERELSAVWDTILWYLKHVKTPSTTAVAHLLVTPVPKASPTAKCRIGKHLSNCIFQMTSTWAVEPPIPATVKIGVQWREKNGVIKFSTKSGDFNINGYFSSGCTLW
jgi:hypothetical protein